MGRRSRRSGRAHQLKRLARAMYTGDFSKYQYIHKKFSEIMEKFQDAPIPCHPPPVVDRLQSFVLPSDENPEPPVITLSDDDEAAPSID